MPQGFFAPMANDRHLSLIGDVRAPGAELLLRYAKSVEARLSDCLIQPAKDSLSLEPEPFLTGRFA